ncbi:MAG: hypothetical protein WC998_07955 [Candidatus Paceibacterota bacterium]|jgi:hypothetical protein
MKNKSYSVVGDKKQGHRIAVPECANPKKGDLYEFLEIIKGYEHVTLPVGSLVYVPAPRPTSKREKKGVSG